MTVTPTNPLRRIISLLRTGPRALILRFYDQMTRKTTGAPVWRLSRLRPHLYIGGQHYKRGWSRMQVEGISSVLNMREEAHNDVASGIGGAAHLQLPTRDNTPVSMDYLHQAADFIKAQSENGGKVYVHCGVGVGRAPSAAAAYFIKHEGMDAIQAITLIRRTRPFVHLTGTQRQQLILFESEVRNGRQAET